MISDLIPSNNEIIESLRLLKLVTLQNEVDRLVTESLSRIDEVNAAIDGKRYRAARIALAQAITAQETAMSVCDQMLEIAAKGEEENKVRRMLKVGQEACTRMERFMTALPVPEPI